MKRHFFKSTTVLGILCVRLLFINGATAQNVRDGVVSQWEVELGMKTGIGYEQRLSDHLLLKANLSERVLSVLSVGTTTGQNEGKKRLKAQGAFLGWVPVVDLSARWHPNPGHRNSGFYLGLGVEYQQISWRLGGSIDPETKFGLGLNLPIGYKYHISERWGIKAEILPEIVSFSKSDNQPYGGFLGLSADIGVTYNF